MATISHVESAPLGFNNLSHVIWETLTETNNDGDAFTDPQRSDRSVEVVGTFGGTSVAIEGSNVLSPGASDWVAVHDPAGTAIAFTSAGCAHIVENMLHYRPKLTGGTSVDVDVHLLSRRTS